jgi:hypothetical protein
MSSLEVLFCAVDDFCQQVEPKWQSELLATGLKTRKRSQGGYQLKAGHLMG